MYIVITLFTYCFYFGQSYYVSLTGLELVCSLVDQADLKYTEIRLFLPLAFSHTELLLFLVTNLMKQQWQQHETGVVVGPFFHLWSLYFYCVLFLRQSATQSRLA